MKRLIVFIVALQCAMLFGQDRSLDWFKFEPYLYNVVLRLGGTVGEVDAQNNVAFIFTPQGSKAVFAAAIPARVLVMVDNSATVLYIIAGVEGEGSLTEAFDAAKKDFNDFSNLLWKYRIDASEDVVILTRRSPLKY